MGFVQLEKRIPFGNDKKGEGDGGGDVGWWSGDGGGLAGEGFEGAQDGVAVGVEDDGRLAEGGGFGGLRRGKGGLLLLAEEFVAVEVDGVVGVFEGVAGEDEDDAVFGVDAAVGG